MKRALAIFGLFLLTLPVAAANVRAPEIIRISAGLFYYGSDRAEREYAYSLDEAAYGHTVTRDQQWYENEAPKQIMGLPGFAISKNLVTNADYAQFVLETGHPAPSVDPATWASYGLVHLYERTVKFQWQNNKPPPGRLNHPVVLVDHRSAEHYAKWLSAKTGAVWRLPTAMEWEKAARGVEGRIFPWGNKFIAEYLNSDDKGPFDTVPVGRYPNGVSPFGMLDAAGEVFEWTSTEAANGRFVVKGGGSWDDKGCGVCRPAAWHTRPADLKHILVGFRLVKKE
ncbi:MAG: formylglycine-generating enzyme family protein [Sneathiella sp.]|nr:formylglycine-generating enzyme family protein [Sneathiella sp.]